MNSALEMSKDEIVTGKEEAITHQIPSHDPPARESSSQKHVTLGANAPVFQPNSANTMESRTHIDPPHFSNYTHPPQTGNSTLANDLTKFLLKKDLLLSRLSYFTDHPEPYAVWKTSYPRKS